jgi:hypothetical protein
MVEMFDWVCTEKQAKNKAPETFYGPVTPNVILRGILHDRDALIFRIA